MNREEWIKRVSGTSYRPSNGTEGMDFICQWCDHCIHEKFNHTQNDNDKKCDILNRSMLHDKIEDGYPTEWVYDENGIPKCTAHVKWDWGKDDDGNWNDPPTPEPIDPNQLCMPFEIDHINDNVTQVKTELETL